ncbi:hypothetical protein ANAPC5_01291 [Anaplasma phagocytophilum]|nr:hypothetical protein ANAPC5_01291 [Anaplasma phagocytophilum]
MLHQHHAQKYGHEGLKQVCSSLFLLSVASGVKLILKLHPSLILKKKCGEEHIHYLEGWQGPCTLTVNIIALTLVSLSQTVFSELVAVT